MNEETTYGDCHIIIIVVMMVAAENPCRDGVRQGRALGITGAARKWCWRWGGERLWELEREDTWDEKSETLWQDKEGGGSTYVGGVGIGRRSAHLRPFSPRNNSGYSMDSPCHTLVPCTSRAPTETSDTPPQRLVFRGVEGVVVVGGENACTRRSYPTNDLF